MVGKVVSHYRVIEKLGGDAEHVLAFDFKEFVNTHGGKLSILRPGAGGVLSDTLLGGVAPPFSVWCHDILYSSCQDMRYTLG